jgi:uroporphyrin-III C-methyltransferase
MERDGFPGLECIVKVIESGSPVIVYMGLSCLTELARELLLQNIEPGTPVQILSKISQSGQKRYSTVIGKVSEFLQQNTPETPSTVIFGKNALKIQMELPLENNK